MATRVRTHRILYHDPPGPKVRWEVGKACDKRGDTFRHEEHRRREVAQINEAAAGLHVGVVCKLEVFAQDTHQLRNVERATPRQIVSVQVNLYDRVNSLAQPNRVYSTILRRAIGSRPGSTTNLPTASTA